MNDEKKFYVARSIVYEKISERRIRIGEDDLKRRIINETTRVLVELLIKELQENDSKLKAERTRLENMKMPQKWRETPIFIKYKVPVDKISKTVDENSTMDSYDIYRKFFKIY